MDVKTRFLQYIALDTTSDENCGDCPSTPNQRALALRLAEEMRALGLDGVRADEHAYVYGRIPGNDPAAPAIGLIAHMDTSDAVPGGPVHARAVRWEGGEILLNAEKNIRLTPDPAHLGHELLVTDGLTLLGGDDKAGVAEIMTLCEYVLAHPEKKHGDICVAFTPDEEIGRGADLFDVKGFGAEFAYTVDGGAVNEIEYENFNAASAQVLVHGFSIHPGGAKNKMRNAARLAMEFNAMLPPQETPECTEGYEGFYHLCEISGAEQEARLQYIIRDHDRQKFEARKARMEKIAAYLNEKYGENTFELRLRDSYYNMREKLEERMEVVERALAALRQCGLTPRCAPIRGGTDGARLSFMGLPCPNLGTGGRNCHGVQEYVSVQEMEKVVEVLQALLLKA